MDPALFRNIALETNDQGSADAQLALAARRLIDAKGDVQFNPDDLPASMRSLGGGGAIPMWFRYDLTLSAILAGVMEPDNPAYFRVPITTMPPGGMIHGAAMKPTQSFATSSETETVDTLQTMVGYSVPGENVYPTGIMNFDVGFGDGPGIENDPSYILRAVAQAPTALDLYPYTSALAWAGTRRVNLYLKFSDNLGVLADYQALTAGGVRVWLLQSVLPSFP